MAREKTILPTLMPALSAGVRVDFSLLSEEAEGREGGGDVVMMNANEDENDREEDDLVMMNVKGDEDDSEEDDDIDSAEADDEDTEVTAERSETGTAVNSCIWLGSGLPPALPRAAMPQVFGSTLSLDVILKVGELAKLSPERLSTCM